MYVHPTGQVEIIDGSLIAWIRTVYPVDYTSYTDAESE